MDAYDLPEAGVMLSTHPSSTRLLHFLGYGGGTGTSLIIKVTHLSRM